MKFFRAFLKHPQLLGLTGYEKKADGSDHKLSKETRAEILELSMQARIFVLDGDLAYKALGKEGDAVPLSLPFKTCWFELLSQNGVASLSVVMDSKAGPDQFVSLPLGMLLQEKSPGVLDVFLMEAHPKAEGSDESPPVGSSVSVFRGVSEENHQDEMLWVILNGWIRCLNAGVLGVEETDDAVQVPRPDRLKKTKPKKVGQIIRITPTNRKDKVLPVSHGGKIDWSHRWEVRGHWRRVEGGLGKNRDGSYEVHGFTWVSSHLKGPEAAPFVPKVRVVKDPEK